LGNFISLRVIEAHYNRLPGLTQRGYVALLLVQLFDKSEILIYFKRAHALIPSMDHAPWNIAQRILSSNDDLSTPNNIPYLIRLKPCQVGTTPALSRGIKIIFYAPV
jgi:hypothetical protein